MLSLVMAKNKKFDVSLIGQHTLVAMDAIHRIGLCMKKFQADVVLSEKEFAALQEGMVLEIAKRKMVVKTIGKGCYDDCILYSSKASCPLRDGCAFGIWLE